MSAEAEALQRISDLARHHGFWDESAAQHVQVCRTSSRFCLGVEHGDYNGTELFGVGTDRFIWLAFLPNATGKVRLVSHNFPDEGVVSYTPGTTTALLTPAEREAASWKQFPLGVDYVLTKHGFKLRQGFDAVVFGNIPGAPKPAAVAFAQIWRIRADADSSHRLASSLLPD
jgi:galactokinase